MVYFAISDVHSFFGPMKAALKNAGYEKNNKYHKLIICGDIFDRGNDTLKVFKYLKSIPKTRRILIRGNHEELFFKLIEKAMPEYHDFTNGTVHTFCDIAGYNYGSFIDLYNEMVQFLYSMDTSAKETLIREWATIVKTVKNSEVYAWLLSNEWVNYAEIDRYIFVHSFIPISMSDEVAKPSRFSIAKYKAFASYRPDWRSCTDAEWRSATWGCPWMQYKAGLFDEEAKNDKVLVCGHWDAAAFHNNLDRNYLETEYTCHTYYGKNIIALDACTIMSNRVNVFKFYN